MDDLTSGRKRARAQDWAEMARALGVAPRTLGAYLLAAQQGESEPTPTLRGEEKGLTAQFEQSQSLIRAAIARRAVRESPAAESGDESASAVAGTAPEAAPDKH